MLIKSWNTPEKQDVFQLVDINTFPFLEKEIPFHSTRRSREKEVSRVRCMISDSLGEPLFFSNGEQIWCKDGSLMSGGSLIDTNYKFETITDTIYEVNGGVFVPLEEDCQRYYYHFYYFAKRFWVDGLIPTAKAEYGYVKIDSWANNGLGAVIEGSREVMINEIVKIGSTNHLPFTVKQTDGIDTWLILNISHSKLINVYRVNSCGVKLEHEYDIAELAGIGNEDFAENYKITGSNWKFFYHGALYIEIFGRGEFLFQFDKQDGTLSFDFELPRELSTYIYSEIFINEEQSILTRIHALRQRIEQYYIDSLRAGVSEPFYDEETRQDFAEGFTLADNTGNFYYGDFRRVNELRYMDQNLPCPACFLTETLEWDYKGENYLEEYVVASDFFQNSSFKDPSYKTPRIFKENESLLFCTGINGEITLEKGIQADSLVWQLENRAVIQYPDSEGDYGQFLTEITAEGEYEVGLKRYLNCVTDTFMIPVKITELLSEDSLYLCHETEVQSTEIKDYHYAWFRDAEELSNDNSLVIREPGEYVLRVENECGFKEDTVLFLEDELVSYNVITPNGDGINETLIIDQKGTDEVELHVFNRWGQETYFSENYEGTWPENVPESGVYFVQSSAGNCEYKGWVTVIR